MKYILFILFAAIAPISFGQFESPKWASNATIYEVNVRQFTTEGTFQSFQKHLPRLQKMGVDIIWFMPIHEIGIKNRKGSLGSYYAVKDYKSVNHEFGTLQDFKNVVDAAHKLGMKVIIDWVANHTSPDNIWVEQGHKDWYTLDSTGNLQPTIGTDWWDVADLNYDNIEMRNEMISSMKYWLTAANIDGFRCDVAGWVPMDFWVEARAKLDEVKKIFFLAESEGVDQHQAFDMTYGWELHHVMNEISKKKKTVSDIYTYFEKNKYPKSAYRMHFTSNHDENSWNGTEMERLGDSRFAFAVFAATIEGMPLVYNGQETSLDRRLKFFEKDSIQWDKMDLVDFYTKLLHVKKTHPAMKSGKNGGDLTFLSNQDKNSPILVYQRSLGKKKVICVINLSEKESKIVINTPNFGGKYKELFSGKKVKLTNGITESLKPWEYRVYSN